MKNWQIEFTSIEIPLPAEKEPAWQRGVQVLLEMLRREKDGSLELPLPVAAIEFGKIAGDLCKKPLELSQSSPVSTDHV